MSGVLDERFDFILNSREERVFALRVIGVYLQSLESEFSQDIAQDDIVGISKGKLTKRQKNALYNWVVWGIHKR